jgi:hypothetical protein
MIRGRNAEMTLWPLRREPFLVHSSRNAGRGKTSIEDLTKTIDSGDDEARRWALDSEQS